MSEDKWIYELVKTASVQVLIFLSVVGICILAFKSIYKRWLHNDNVPKNKFLAKIKETLIDTESISRTPPELLAVYIVLFVTSFYCVFFI